jgi:uncharacterized protein (TIGR02145 family)
MKNLIAIFIMVVFCSFQLTNLKAQTVKDIDGNEYNTVEIGTQTWMSENLKVTHLNDGKAIPLKSSNWSQVKAPAYCWYENDSLSYSDAYGALYNAYTVNTEKLCPLGWHVPTYDDMMILSHYITKAYNYADILKEKGTEHWIFTSADVTDRVGFSARGGGGRSNEGEFSSIRFEGDWWSAPESSQETQPLFFMKASDDGISHFPECNKMVGASVRCLKD